jgi:hypothetical protein
MNKRKKIPPNQISKGFEKVLKKQPQKADKEDMIDTCSGLPALLENPHAIKYVNLHSSLSTLLNTGVACLNTGGEREVHL